MSDQQTVEQDMAEIILGLQATNANLTAANLKLQRERDELKRELDDQDNT